MPQPSHKSSARIYVTLHDLHDSKENLSVTFRLPYQNFLQFPGSYPKLAA
jgi:hypothetical protein